jgi:hypothetical protein
VTDVTNSQVQDAAEKNDPAGRNGENSRNGHRAKPRSTCVTNVERSLMNWRAKLAVEDLGPAIEQPATSTPQHRNPVRSESSSTQSRTASCVQFISHSSAPVRSSPSHTACRAADGP